MNGGSLKNGVYLYRKEGALRGVKSDFNQELSNYGNDRVTSPESILVQV